MRYEPEHKAQTRDRIVRNAARKLRAEGLKGPGVAGVMKASGLTVGGFYRHFRSKHELFAEISRAYLNLFYSPSDAITFRITPNIFRDNGTVPAVSQGAGEAIPSTANGNLTYRLKYAYADFNTLFAGISPLKDDKLTVGQQMNVLVDWEETMYGYRWVSLSSPWNYLSLASAQAGVRLHGPVEFGGKQYLDYDVGVFGNGTFHSPEESDERQVMGRFSFYPFGAISTYQGLGLTGIIDYGYTNVLPDNPAASWPIYRVAALAHYTTKTNFFNIAGEYERGRNAFTSVNLFSGAGPADEFGLGPTQYAAFDGLAKALLDYNGTEQQGFTFSGHVNIPKSKFAVFGEYEYFQPNIRVPKNPFDFTRLVVGFGYKLSNGIQVAIDSQNLFYNHSQFAFPESELAQFNPSLAAENPGGIPNAVPTDIRAIFLSFLFNFDKTLAH
jgi:hypothetical protein